jgi:hypothetical protein
LAKWSKPCPTPPPTRICSTGHGLPRSITTSSTADFQINGGQAQFIFANLDGSISAWNGGASSTIEATVPGASFTGLAIGNTSTGAAQLYAADQNSGNIDVFNSYVAATINNEIFAVKHASKTHWDDGTGALVYEDQAHLRGPIGLALLPNGDLLTTNDDAVNADASQPSELLEFTPDGQFVGELSLDPALGKAFQIVVQSTHKTVTIASVNDDLATVDLRTIAL